MARDLETDPASMTRTLDRLAAKGLVQRERSTADRRVVHLTLTDEGKLVAAKVPRVLADVLNGHLIDFTHDEWQMLLNMLRRMLANGESLRQQTPPPPDDAAG
jgi:DNA-binding MarR family transcriptional regulator